MHKQGLCVDVHGLADGLKALVEAGLAKAAGLFTHISHPDSAGTEAASSFCLSSERSHSALLASRCLIIMSLLHIVVS